MPAGATFNRLHDVIQNITNFQSGYPHDFYHLFQFEIPQENLVVTNDLQEYEENKLVKKEYKNVALDENNDPFGVIAKHLKTTVRQPQTIKIDKYIEKYGKLDYVYDFGDHWEFEIVLEEIVDDYYYGYPSLIDGAETAPPEDVGGIPGYYDFLEIIHDEKHPDHQAMKTWAEEQKYRAYDKDWTNRMLKGIKYKKTEWDKING